MCKQNFVFSESKFGPPVPEISGSSPRISAMNWNLFTHMGNETSADLSECYEYESSSCFFHSIHFSFWSFLYLQDSCDKEKCRKEVAGKGEYKAVNCKVSCCETDRCNMAVVSKGQVSSISILGLIISLLSCYSFQNYKLMSFQNY